MSYQKPLWKKRFLAFLLSLLLIGSIVTFVNSTSFATSRLQSLVRQLRGVPPATKATGSTTGGGGRGPICVLPEAEVDASPKSLVALMPIIQVEASGGSISDGNNGQTSDQPIALPNELVYVGGYTTEEQPTFWFYIPYIAEPDINEISLKPTADTNSRPVDSQNIRVGKFVLLDQDRRPVSSFLMAIELLPSPRMVAFQLPTSLELDRLYNWHFSMVCEPDKPSRNPVVRGWVQRIEVSPALAIALQRVPPFERYLAYAEDDIWFEALSELIATRRQFSTLPQAQEIWRDLLLSFNIFSPETVDLSVTEPIQVREDFNRQSQLPARM